MNGPWRATAGSTPTRRPWADLRKRVRADLKVGPLANRYEDDLSSSFVPDVTGRARLACPPGGTYGRATSDISRAPAAMASQRSAPRCRRQRARGRAPFRRKGFVVAAGSRRTPSPDFAADEQVYPRSSFRRSHARRSQLAMDGGGV